MAKREKFLGMAVRDLDEEPTKAASEEVKAEEVPTKEGKESKPEISPEVKSDKKSVYGVVANCEMLNLREQDNQVSKVLKVIPKGTKIEIMEEFGKWYRVKFNGYDGYVMAQYVEVM